MADDVIAVMIRVTNALESIGVSYWPSWNGTASERQWRDVLGVLKVQAGALDIDYLRRMAHELKVEDLLLRALKEA